MAEEFSLSIKLLIDNQNNRVLFAEANKDCVDFLFHTLSLPMSRIIRLLKEDGMLGSVGNIYESIENLNETYVLPAHSKDSLLKPSCSGCACSLPILQLETTPIEKKFYRCSHCGTQRVTDDLRSICPSCSRNMMLNVPYVAPPTQTNEGGFVKGVITYTVTDDLVVMPMSTISCIALLNKLNVKDVSILEEKVVKMSMVEAVKLLRASLYSKNVLTEVFIPINKQNTASNGQYREEEEDDAVNVH